MAEQIEMKCYTYDRLSMGNKRFTHMMSLVTSFGSHIGFTPKPIKMISLKRSPGKGLQSLIALFLVLFYAFVPRPYY